MKAEAISLVVLLIAGCATHPGCLADDTNSRRAVLSYLRVENAPIAGPLRSLDLPVDAKFGEKDLKSMQALFRSGAIAYLVFGPDYHTEAHDAEGKPIGFVRIDRIVMLRQEQIVGEFVAL